MPINDGLPFRTASAPDLGLTRHQLRELVRTHQVRRLFHGVFVDFAVADSRELRVAALGLVIPPGAIVSDHSAAWVYGVDTFPPGAMREMRPMIEETVDRMQRDLDRELHDDKAAPERR